MSARDQAARRPLSEAATWQRVEFGSYTADLPLWDELADREGGSDPVLELGAGWGRVARHLALRGQAVSAIERDPDLVEDLKRASEADDLPIRVEQGDIARLDEAAMPAAKAAIAPLHLLQQIEPRKRPIVLRFVLDLLRPGAPAAVTLLDEESLFEGGIEGGSVPDMVEIEGWVYSSEPLWVQVGDETITVRRLRQRVSPGGEIERSVHDELLHRLDPAKLEAEAEAVGLRSAERRSIRSGPAEADSVAVIVEAS